MTDITPPADITASIPSPSDSPTGIQVPQKLIDMYGIREAIIQTMIHRGVGDHLFWEGDLRDLIERGVICAEYKHTVDDAADILWSRREFAVDFSENGLKCEWCRFGVETLHYQHYPRPRNQGGHAVVKICGTCHLDFHKLTKKRRLFVPEAAALILEDK